MNRFHAIDLYQLLPALYRQRDAERGYPLRALLEIVSDQVDIVKQDIDGLWDDCFIETCAEWVIPYIGELVGNNLLHELDLPLRADVAKTIYYRRRKGTLPMLEELARDVTGWSAHATACFELLGWTQNLNHLRYQTAVNPKNRHPNAMARVGTVNLRSMDVLDRIDAPFDITSHSVDVRRISQYEGRYNIGNVALFLWRLDSYGLAGVEPDPSKTGSHRFHFSPLGNPMPLFHKPQTEVEEAELATEIHVAGPIRPLAFYARPQDYYGHKKSLAIYRGPVADENNLVPVGEILCKNLKNWVDPPTDKVAVDVASGRLAFAPGKEPKQLTVAFHYGFSADIGGGPYTRVSSIDDGSKTTWNVTVSRQAGKADYSSLSGALADWQKLDAKQKKYALITLQDNATYDGSVSIALEAAQRLVIQAADRHRPFLRLQGDFRVKGGHAEAELTLNGLLIEGALEIQGELRELNLLHCTLVPGNALDEQGKPLQRNLPSLSATPETVSKALDIDHINVDHCIVGALRLPQRVTALTVQDSVVDGLDLPAISDTKNQLGPATTLQRVTLFGRVSVRELTLASEVIFNGRVSTERCQTGCVRFSYLDDADHSRTPRRYRCQPDLALAQRAAALGLDSLDSKPVEKTAILDRLQPAFTSIHYGDPGYAQLIQERAKEIHNGAEDGSEMGAFCHLKQTQRQANLRIRLEEYLPFGLEAGLIFVT